MKEIGNKGVAMVIALIMSAIFMLLAAEASSLVISQMQQTSDFGNSIQAYYTAESGINAGLYHLIHKTGTYEGVWDYSCEPDKPSKPEVDENCAEGSWQIVGMAGENKLTDRYYIGGGYNGFYSYPIPGTGTVGVDCDLLDPVLETNTVLMDNDKCKNSDISNMTSWEKFQCGILQKIKKSKDPKDVVSSKDTENTDKNSGLDDYLPAIMGPNGEYSNAADLPCNWNKIKFGDTVNIPLYGLSESGEPVPLKLDNFILRVRTPCVAECDGSCKKPPEFCEERYKLGSVFDSGQGTFPENILKDVVITWAIENGDCSGVYCYLDNMIAKVTGFDQELFEQQDTSLITAHRITQKLDEFDGKFEVLVQDGIKNSSNVVHGLKNSDVTETTKLGEFLGMYPEEESEDEEEIKLT
ncbi:pilus assembly PilX N-terminal domain-containing protein, partial [Patescibacteria group bacterium]|nr:pilus assembly PilX N-terminal domain-containing protein [Patescibacteria group bacterium]